MHKSYLLFKVDKTGCNNVVLRTLFIVVDSGSTMLNNIVDNYEQCRQHNIVASCFYQPHEQVIIFGCVQPVSSKRNHHQMSWSMKSCKLTHG